MDMATREDLGLVWMGTGDVLMQPDSSDHIFSQQNENPFYTDGVQALQSLEDMRQPLGMDGFTVLDELEPYCEESPRYVASAATQTAQPPGTRKIRPIKHPGLKLKTPIAYQGDTDPSVIPIERDGMAVCQKCGAIGVKHAFYTKERRFCSRACAKGSGEAGGENSNDATSLKVQQQSQPQLPPMQTQNLMQSRIPTQIHPQMQTQLQPQMQAQLQPQMQAQLQSQMQGQLQPQMQAQLQPQMQGQLQPQMQGQLQPQMQGQLQSQMQGQLQPQISGQMQPQLVSQMHLQPQMQQPLQPQMQSQVAISMQPQVPMQIQPIMHSQMQQSQMHMQPQMQMQHMHMQMQPHMQMHIQPQMQIEMQPQIQMQNVGQMQSQVQSEAQKGWCTDNNMAMNTGQDSCSSSSEAGDTTPHPPPPMSPLPPLQLFEPAFPPDKKSCPDLARTHEWDSQLTEPGFLAAPVSCFNHAPMADNWDNITVGMKVEVQNTDCDNFSEDFPDSFWVATVLKISGYKALLRYEGFGQNSSKDFWVNLCSSLVHHVGWCAIRGRPLIPPKTVEHKYSDWKDFLVKRLTGARTLPSNFYNKVHDSLKSRLRCNLNVEVVDKNRLTQVKVATVEKIVGKRVQVRYVGKDDGDDVFWCHEDSALIHPVGWAIRVGHEIEASGDYIERCRKKTLTEDDATDELFPGQLFQQRLAAKQAAEWAANGLTSFTQGMKLEAIDPLNLSSICVATVMKVLRDGYIMIRIDSYDADVNCSDWFCYHQTSPCIFPAGFCHANSISLTPPKGIDPGEFDWSTYLEQSHAIAAPNYLFKQLQEIPLHGFVESMHLEATDIMDPRLVCVATVARVVGRLLKVHFDGWDDEYDQWLDCCSPDIYPVGWCQLVSHKLEAPHVKLPTKPNAATGKTQRGVRGKRGRRMQKRRTAGGAVMGMGLGMGLGLGMKKSPGGTLQPFSDSASSATLIGDNDSQSDSQCAVESSGDFGDEPEPIVEHNQVLRLAPVEDTPVNCNPHTGGTKLIPRLIDPPTNQETGDLVPSEWDVNDVVQFLRVNDCAAYCENFVRKEVDGKALLNLTKDQVMDLTGMKVGPSLKISDLIQQLRVKVNPAQERAKASFKKLL